MSIKIIATDLDGTLMSSDHMTVTEYTKSTLLKATQKGIKLAIATGRPMSLIENVIEQVPFADYVIYSNGACVFDIKENKIIVSELIDAETTSEALSYFLNEKVFFEVYLGGKSHYQLGTEAYYGRGALPDEFVDEIFSTMEGHGDLLEFTKGREIEKITMFSIKNDRYLKYADKLKSYNLDVATSLPECLEGTSKKATKGNALKGICDALGISADEAMCFGDGGNDCSMLEFAKYSFAMENALPECKASARYMAESNANDGVAKAVEKYCLK